MIPEQRRDFIYRYVHEKNAASFNELADLMSVSHISCWKKKAKLSPLTAA